MTTTNKFLMKTTFFTIVFFSFVTELYKFVSVVLTLTRRKSVLDSLGKHHFVLFRIHPEYMNALVFFIESVDATG